MKMKLSLLAASAILAVGMTGCWTESSPDVNQLKFVAKALDGYILDSNTSCFDVNRNGQCGDATDIVIHTDHEGKYNVSVANSQYPVIIQGGTLNGKPFTGILKALPNSKVASPLTTLIADGMDPADAKAMLGLSPTDDLYADYLDTTATDDINSKITKAALTAQTVIAALTASLSSNGLSASENMKIVITALAAVYKSAALTATPLDLTNATTVAISLSAIITEVNSDPKIVAAGILVPTSYATTISEATKEVQIATITKSTLVDLEEKIATVIEESTPSNFVTIANNTFTVAGKSVSFTQDGVFPATEVSSASNVIIGFNLENNNNALDDTEKDISVAILIDDANSGRELKAVLVGAKISSAGIKVPTTAKLYVEGKDSNGGAIAVTSIDNNGEDLKTVNGATTFDLTNVMNRIKNKVSSSQYISINEIGTYNVSFYVGGISVGFDGTTIKTFTTTGNTLSIQDTPTTIQSVTGTMFTGTLTVN